MTLYHRFILQSGCIHREALHKRPSSGLASTGASGTQICNPIVQCIYLTSALHWAFYLPWGTVGWSLNRWALHAHQEQSAKRLRKLWKAPCCEASEGSTKWTPCNSMLLQTPPPPPQTGTHTHTADWHVCIYCVHTHTHEHTHRHTHCAHTHTHCARTRTHEHTHNITLQLKKTAELNSLSSTVSLKE